MDQTPIPPAIPMNQEQVKCILKYIDATQSEQVKRDIFNQLGRECFQCGHHEQWLAPFVGHVQAYLDRINVEQKSPYWESLVYSEDKTALILTGRKVTNCVCAFADCSEPPRSLCQYCCKQYQEVLFQTLLGQEVEVEITASFLLGQDRCNTIIRIR